jgi:hypothetical protein
MIFTAALMSLILSFISIAYIKFKNFDVIYYSKLSKEQQVIYLQNYTDNSLKFLSQNEIVQIQTYALMFIVMLLLLPYAYFFGL